MNLALAQAIRVTSSPCIAFIGAGGKTTAMFRLARELPAPVIVTATSHLGAWQIKFADQHVIAETPAPLERLEHRLNGVILVTGEMAGERTKPINDDLLSWLHQFCGYHSIPLLIEADGSREKPMKAWAEHEPPIPAFAELVVQVVGLKGLGRPLTEENVHRSELFSKLSKLRMGESITPYALVKVLTHPEGGFKNIPPTARRAVLLNQADTDELQSAAQGLSQLLIPPYDSTVITSLEQQKIFAVHEPIAGIILAAGESTRFGQAKQLLDWKGQPFVRAIARTALEAGLDPVLVMTGANAEKVEVVVRDLNVTIVKNDEWKSGQGSSIREGVRALMPPPGPPLQSIPEVEGRGQIRLQSSLVHKENDSVGFRRGGRKAVWAGGAIFLLADQPQVTTSIIRALVEKHAEGLYPVVAPLVLDQRANPVLFDRVTFPDLMKLEGDVGGRAIFHKYRVEYLPWHDDRLLLDVDTPEMYQRLISDESL